MSRFTNLQSLAVGLNIPEYILNNLDKERNNRELKVFCTSVPDILYPDTYILSGRILIYLNLKSAAKNMDQYLTILDSILSENQKKFIRENKEIIDSVIDETADYNYNYYDLLSASSVNDYLLKLSADERPCETPCQFKMRQAIQFYFEEGMERVLKCYYELLEMKYIHASPTMFNAGTKKNQLSSCFLLNLSDDLESILYTGAGDVGMISKLQGGIGLGQTRLRHSKISNTGSSSGVCPFDRVFDSVIRVVDQGGKRNGAMTITLADWHLDIIDFVKLRDNTTHDGIRLKQANICVFASSLMKRRAEKNEKWTLFCPKKTVMTTADEDGVEREVSLLGLYFNEFDYWYPRFEEEAERRKKIFDAYDKEVEDKEIYVNSHPDDEKAMMEYYDMEKKRIEMRKWIIDYKTIDAKFLYDLIADMNMKCSMPYMCYSDTFNYKNNMKNVGPTLNSNLCVAPETLVLTDNGHRKISNLENQKINVWNGKEFSEVTVRKTGENKEVMKVYLSDGMEITCTPQHKFYIQKGYRKHHKNKDILDTCYVNKVEAKDLKSDMKIIKCSYPVIEGGKNLNHAYTNGFFTGDGTYNISKREENKCTRNSVEGMAYCRRHRRYQQNNETSEVCLAVSNKRKPKVCLYGEKMKLLEHLDYLATGEVKDNRLNVDLTRHLEDKFFVPLNHSLKSKLDWFAGFCDADGVRVMNGKNQSLQATSIDKKFLIKVKLMLQTCGINPKVCFCYNPGQGLLPDGKGGKKLYDAKPTWRLIVSSTDVQKLLANGFSPKRLNFVKEHVQREASQFVTIVKTENRGRICDTFCFTEPKRNAGIFNGVITGQCLEISLPSDEENISSCNLGHLNLKKYVTGEFKLPHSASRSERLAEFRRCYNFTELGNATRSLTENINKVIDYNYYPLDERDQKGNVTKQGKISRTNLRDRPLGIGVSGLAETFALLDIYYESEEAELLNKMIFACMYYNGLKESLKLAERDGEYGSFRYGSFSAYDSITKTFREYKGSPLSNGMFQFDMWQQEADYLHSKGQLDTRFYKMEDNIPIEPREWGDIGSWSTLRRLIMKNGVRNSMILALMPTASSAQQLRNGESTEAHQTCLYSRKLQKGNFTVFSEPFVADMIKYKLWTKRIIDFIMCCNGTIAYLLNYLEDHPSERPEGLENKTIEHLQKKHKNMYEISQKQTLLMARQRGIYVDQSQSLNCYFAEPTKKKMKAFHSMGEALRLKTGMYYLRANPAFQTDRLTIDIEVNEYAKRLTGVDFMKTSSVKVSVEEEIDISIGRPIFNTEKERKKFECREINGVEACVMCQ